MKEIILLKLGEIVLKGLNRRKFEDKLIGNIRKQLKDCGGFTIKNAQSTIYVFPKEDFLYDEAIIKLKKVFGIVSIVRAKELPKDMDEIVKIAPDYVKDILVNAKTFKCESKRSDKAFPYKSPEINTKIGEAILNKFPHLTVDVHNPDVTIIAEIRDYGAYIHSAKIKGAGGMPVGSNSKATLLLSGGIDSPVAGYMTAKRGVQINAVHFYSYPYTSERAREKVIKLARIISEYTGNFKLFLVPFTGPQLEIYEKCPDDELTIIMRRIMMKISEKIASITGSVALITGESIGQVASQTMESLAVTDASTNLPVIRPLIAMDKDEIVEISRHIDTFETSILPYEDCCTVFVPKHPKTKPKLENIIKSESILNIDEIVEKCVAECEVIKISPEE